MTQSPHLGAIFLLAAQPTDRALTGWHVNAGDFSEQLAGLGITYETLQRERGAAEVVTA